MAPRPVRLGPSTAAVRLRKAADDREAEPSAWPLGCARAALERLEDRKEVFRRQAHPLVPDSDDHFTALGVDRHRNPRLGRGELDRILEQIDERPLNLAGVDVDRRSHREVRPSPVCIEPRRIKGPPHQLIHRPKLLTYR